MKPLPLPPGAHSVNPYAYARAVAAGAESLMAPADMYYGDRHGGVRDACGNAWWIATHIEDVEPAELQRRHAAEQRRRAAAAANTIRSDQSVL